jgi:hypothetical protein
MQQLAEYKRQAQECKDMAARATSSEMREQLLRLAKQWCELAKERQDYLDAKASGQPH